MFRLSVFVYLMFSTFSVVGFFLPIYLQNKGLDPASIGTIIGMGAFVSMFAQPFWGYVSDKRKTVKRVLQLLLLSVFLLSFGLFSAQTLLWITLFYTIFMFFSSSTGPLTDTLCISYAYENQKDYGRIRLWGEIGVGTSAFLLGFLLEQFGVNRLGWIYIFFLSFAIAGSFLIKDSKSTPVPVRIAALGKLFSQPKLLGFLLMILLIGIPHRMNDSMLGLYLRDLGASESQIGLAWLAATTSTVPALLFTGLLIKKWNERGILMVAAALYSIRWLIYSQAEHPSVLIMFQMLHGLTFPLFLVASIHYLTSIVPVELRATGQAAFAVTFGGLAGIIGSSAGGFVMERFSPSAAYSSGSLLALAGAGAAATAYFLSRRKRSPEMPQHQIGD